MKRLIVPLAVLALAACASVPVTGSVEPLFADALFAPPAQRMLSEDIFALSEDMRDYLDHRIAGHTHRKGPRLGLFEVLRDELKIEYDSAMTRNAAQAFEARSGNCLSLVILTAALAKQLKIPVTYQSVSGQDTWSRSSGVAFRSNHVNLVLGMRGSGFGLKGEDERPLTIDFLPSTDATRLHARPVPEETVVAMYFNNRAAETLAVGNLDQAYWLARQAIITSPSFMSAYNTLGVIYRRHGNLAEAERTLRYALEREPGNAQVLSNLAGAVAAQGRAEEAKELRKRLAEIAAFPPFHFYDLGRAALARGETDAAIAWFKKELARMPYDDELHFMLAVARLRRGEVRSARKHMTLAMENSTTRDRRGIYAAKLDYLRGLHIN